MSGCSDSSMSLEQYQGQKTVVLILDELNTQDIPSDLSELRKVADLTISQSAIESGWSIYPPNSYFENRPLEPPFKTLPASIGQLKNLKSLKLMNMDLGELPMAISELTQLEYLDLSMNKLDMSKEIKKLETLPNLKYLRVWGNHFDEVVMLKFQEDHPGLKLDYKVEER